MSCAALLGRTVRQPMPRLPYSRMLSSRRIPTATLMSGRMCPCECLCSPLQGRCFIATDECLAKQNFTQQEWPWCTSCRLVHPLTHRGLWSGHCRLQTWRCMAVMIRCSGDPSSDDESFDNPPLMMSGDNDAAA
eukprot:4734176-Amphidinium_carterae.1